MNNMNNGINGYINGNNSRRNPNNFPDTYYGSRRGGGIGKGLMVLVGLAILMFGGYMITGNLKSSGTTSEPEVIVVPGENAAAVGTETKDVTPINIEYSCRGNYYSVFTRTQNVTDNFGTVYDTAYMANVGINACTKKLTYRMDGSYTSLSGTIYLSEKNKDNINYFRVYIYNENGDCIYQSADINDKTFGPITVDCDITGLEMVTIEMEGCTNTCSTVSVIMPEEGVVFTGPKMGANAE